MEMWLFMQILGGCSRGVLAHWETRFSWGDEGLILRSGGSRGDVKVYGEMWWFKSRCKGSWEDVVTPVEVRKFHEETW